MDAGGTFPQAPHTDNLTGGKPPARLTGVLCCMTLLLINGSVLLDFDSSAGFFQRPK